MNHDNNFDLLRLLAAAQVVFCHSMAWLNLAPQLNSHLFNLVFGFPGVAIFFTVSGFLISRSWLNPETTTEIYTDHRARRIYPALWANILTILVVLYFIDELLLDNPTRFIMWTATALVTGCDCVGTIGIGSVVTPTGFYHYFPSGVLWTIPVELSFYLLIPLIFQKSSRRSQLTMNIVAVFTISMLFQFLWPLSGDPYSIMQCLWIFLTGAAINLHWDRLKPMFVGKAIYWVPAYLVMNFTAQTHGLDYSVASYVNVVQTFFLSFTVISAAHSFRPLFGILRGHDISYGLYLWHMPVIWTMRGLDLNGHWRWLIVAYLIAATIAVLSWLLIERPMLKGKIRGAGKPFIKQTPRSV